MKKILALALTALLAAVLIPNAVMADGITIEVPEEMELPSWNVLDDPGEGYATVEEAAAAIGKTALTGIYTYVNGGEGYGGEGSENLWDNKTGSKYCTGTFPTVSIAQLDGTYKVDGIILATANDNASYNDRNPFEWCVYGSADGVTWTPLAYGDDTFFEEVNFTYFPAALTVDGEYEFIMFYSDGALSGTFQMSECVICGERTGDSKVEAEKVELPAVAEWIDYTAGTPIANNGAEYEDEAAAVASIGKTPIDGVTFVLREEDGLDVNPRKHGDMRGGAEAVPFHKAQVQYGVLADGKGQDVGVNRADKGLAALFRFKDGFCFLHRFPAPSVSPAATRASSSARRSSAANQ